MCRLPGGGSPAEGPLSVGQHGHPGRLALGLPQGAQLITTILSLRLVSPVQCLKNKCPLKTRIDLLLLQLQKHHTRFR